MKQYDLVIIGAGPGGYVAAVEAAKLGQTVAVVEKKAIGGTCLNVGCIPSKSYLKHASWMENMKEAEKYGIKNQVESIDFDRLVQRKDEVVNQLQKGIYYLFKSNKVDYYEGIAEVNKEKEVAIGSEKIKGKNILLATGSSPFVPPIKGIEKVDYLTTDTFFEMKTLPKKLTIIGGGVIAIELAFAMAPLGVEVVVIEVADDILLTEDGEAREIIKKQLKQMNVKVYAKAKIKNVTEKAVELADTVISFDKLLVATGRKADLTLAKQLEVELTESGKFIEVDNHYETSSKGIFAIGDLVDSYMLAHVASKEGIKAVRYMANKPEKRVFNEDVPKCVYTNPEIASFGLTELEAKEKGYEVIVSKMPFGNNGKGIAAVETQGFVKIISEAEHHELLGAVVVGSHGTEMIHTLLAVKESEGRVEELDTMIFAHPTLSEVIGETASELLEI